MAKKDISLILSLIDKLSAPLKKTTYRIDRRAKKNKATFQKMSIAGGAAFVGIGLGIKKLVDGASDLVEINQKFGVVYSKMTEKADQTAKTLSSSYGLARKDAKGYLADIGDLVSGLGFSQEASLQFGETVVSLGTDLASFSNIQGGVDESVSRLNKGLLGEHENLKALGIQIDENMVKERLVIMGKDKLVGLALKQAKVEARLQMVMEQSKNAIGDYARSKYSLANTTKLLQSRITDLKNSIGVAFYPAVLKITNAIIPLIDKSMARAEANPQVSKTIGMLALGITGLIAVIGTLGLAIPSIILGAKALGGALTFLAMNPIGLTIVAIGAMVAAGVTLYKHREEVEYFAKQSRESIKNTVSGAMESLSQSINRATSRITNTRNNTLNGILGAVTGRGGSMFSVFYNSFENIKGAVASAVGWISGKITGVLNAVSNAVARVKRFVGIGNSAKANISSSVNMSVAGSRPIGGTVLKGQTYRVGELGPEYFTPAVNGKISPAGSGGSSPNISINMGTVIVNNEADENRLVAKIKNVLYREFAKANMGYI